MPEGARAGMKEGEVDLREGLSHSGCCGDRSQREVAGNLKPILELMRFDSLGEGGVGEGALLPALSCGP